MFHFEVQNNICTKHVFIVLCGRFLLFIELLFCLTNFKMFVRMTGKKTHFKSVVNKGVVNNHEV